MLSTEPFLTSKIIRAVSPYHGKTIVAGSLTLKKGKRGKLAVIVDGIGEISVLECAGAVDALAHRDLKYRVTLDDETFVVSAVRQAFD